MLASLSILFSPLLAASGLALPTSRATPTACAAFANGVPAVAQFTLSAHYVNATTRPQTLVLGAPSAASNESYLGTAETIRVPVGSTFAMAQSGVTARPVAGAGAPSVSRAVPGSNALLTFTADAAAPAQAYCELVNTDPNGSPYPYPVLAVNSDSENFSVCRSEGGEDVVVYNASSATTVYDAGSCQKVHVLLVQPRQ
ncbi:hypothetical protein FA95DRAFT_825917 [Auriscalpium vulgare]|uniref:Uncharacterized protein n=1 Tax=Auriscalpium vulgare TaxID=40419 RepID=A0ACB8R9E1_9AGAM|nr:hypothetical protein FA95DRAFT_825917 [Auriscalpium vulgare]